MGFIKDYKKRELERNRTNAMFGVPGAQSRAEQLSKEIKGSEVRNATIAGGIIGGIVAGPAGAIVGAMASKAKKESK